MSKPKTFDVVLVTDLGRVAQEIARAERLPFSRDLDRCWRHPDRPTVRSLDIMTEDGQRDTVGLCRSCADEQPPASLPVHGGGEGPS